MLGVKSDMVNLFNNKLFFVTEQEKQHMVSQDRTSSETPRNISLGTQLESFYVFVQVTGWHGTRGIWIILALTWDIISENCVAQNPRVPHIVLFGIQWDQWDVLFPVPTSSIENPIGMAVSWLYLGKPHMTNSNFIYPLVMTNIAMENHNFSWENIHYFYGHFQ